MTHEQKPDFVFQRNERVHLSRQGASVQSTTGSRGLRISGSNAGYTMFGGSVKSTGHPLTSFPFTSPPVRHHVPSHFNWSLTNTYLVIPVHLSSDGTSASTDRDVFSSGTTFPLVSVGMQGKSEDGQSTWVYAMQLGSEYR
jgi:hypothetical protein